MKTIKPKYDRPITGTGKAKVGKSTFTLDLTYKDGKGNEEQDTFTFKIEDLPESVPDGWTVESGKSYFASISADEKNPKLLNIRPAKGTFTVRWQKISETQDGDILIITREGEYGPYSQFVPLLTVQKGPHKGVDFPLYLPWASGDKSRLVNDDGLMAISGDREKSKGIAMLSDFAAYSVGEADVPYPMNEDDEPDDDPQAVIGALFKAARKAKIDFIVLVENGYPKSLAELDEETAAESEPDEPDEAKEEEKKPAKVNGKKRPKWDED